MMKGSKEKPFCPKCHSKKVAKIFYGMPAFSESLKRRIDSKKVVLGGCLVSENSPKYKCIACREEFGLYF